MAESKKNLAAKLLAIQHGVESIPKRGFNAHFKYAFVQAGDVYDTIRRLMVEHGVFLTQSALSTSYPHSGLALVEWEFRFHDAESGEVLTVNWSSEGQDKGDKAINKAATAARKYFLITNFMIPAEVMDSDHDGPPKPTGPRAPKKPSENGDEEARKKGVRLIQSARRDYFKDEASFYAWLAAAELAPYDGKKGRVSLSKVDAEGLRRIYREMRNLKKVGEAE